MSDDAGITRYLFRRKALLKRRQKGMDPKRTKPVRVRWLMDTVEGRLVLCSRILEKKPVTIRGFALAESARRWKILLRDDQFTAESDVGFQLTNQGYAALLLTSDCSSQNCFFVIPGSALKWSVVSQAKAAYAIYRF
ncbi:MAG: hypothetical protein R3C12_22205 [Planctomycetaceae bacterium]